MKTKLNILFAACLFAGTAYSQEPQTKTKTTTTTTTETEQKATPDTVVKVEQAPAAEKQEAKSSDEWKGFHIGAVGQATFTDIKLNGDNGELTTEYVVGYGAGGFIGYFFNPHVELRAEALYSSLAQRVIINETKRDLNLSYINFPLLLGLHSGYNKSVSINIVAGPQIGINTGSSLDGEGSEGVDTVQATVKVKPADIGFAYGAGLDFGFGPEKLVHLNVGFRGVAGIVDISDESNNTTTNNYYILDRSKLRTYSGYAGLSLKF